MQNQKFKLLYADVSYLNSQLGKDFVITNIKPHNGYTGLVHETIPTMSFELVTLDSRTYCTLVVFHIDIRLLSHDIAEATGIDSSGLWMMPVFDGEALPKRAVEANVSRLMAINTSIHYHELQGNCFVIPALESSIEEAIDTAEDYKPTTADLKCIDLLADDNDDDFGFKGE